MTAPRYRQLLKRVGLGAVTLPLLQAGCTLDALAQSLASEIIASGTQFTFAAAEIIFRNILGL